MKRIVTVINRTLHFKCDVRYSKYLMNGSLCVVAFRKLGSSHFNLIFKNALPITKPLVINLFISYECLFNRSINMQYFGFLDESTTMITIILI